jgi:Spy/CpxP family protein refolding chaperone
MNGKWMLPLVLAVAALAFAAGRWSTNPPAAFDPLHDLDAARLTGWLGLSEAQAAELQSIEAPFVQKVSAACDQQCAARCELAVSLAQDRFDADRARRLVETMCDAHKANELATVEHLAQVHRILTAEQRKVLLDTVGRCLCTTCGSGGPSCCAATNELNGEEADP